LEERLKDQWTEVVRMEREKCEMKISSLLQMNETLTDRIKRGDSYEQDYKIKSEEVEGLKIIGIQIKRDIMYLEEKNKGLEEANRA
jgi:hypothetical protein